MSIKDPEFGESENQTCPRRKSQNISVSFAVRGDNLMLSDVTNAFQVKPSWSFVKDEIYTVKKIGQRKRPWTLWGIDSDGFIQSDDINNPLEFILNILEPNHIFAEQLVNDPDLYTGIHTWVEPEDGVFGFGIGSKMMHRLTRFCHDIGFSFIGVKRE